LDDAFKIFDTDNSGTITETELREGLAEITIFPTSDELNLYVTRYDKGGDRRLNRREFSESFLAIEAYYANMVERRGSNNRVPLYRRDDCFMQDTALEFMSVWRTHF